MTLERFVALAPMTTKYLACPTEIVEAPVAVVWKLLTNISGWGSFFDLRVISVEPPGPAAKGQRMLGETGPRWLHLGGSFEYTLIDEAHYKLEMDVRLSLGMTVHEALDCVPLEDGRCRVNYHCNFGFPSGWRGRLMRVLLSRGLKTGPADSLWGLKRAAEQEHRGCVHGAGRVGARLSDAERGLSDRKRAVAQAEGDEYRQI